MRKELTEKVELAKARKRAKEQSNVANILAIDPATQCGWALETTEWKNYEVGTWDLSLKRDESNGMKWIRFRGKLREMHQQNELDLIVYEMPAGRNTGAVIHHAKLAGIIEEFCVKNKIEYMALSGSRMKKLATGNGNCGKPLMIQAAKDKLGYEGDDDNEADALWCLQLAKSEFNL